MKLGPTELLLILAIVLVLFGGRKIPEIARGLGEGIKNFRDSMRDQKSASDKPAEEKK
jgi:twin arginine-targeting protein translocase, TatA/E family